MDKVNFSFRGIQDLCRIYYRDIIERRNIKRFLLSRRVRFINPWGKFDYAYFGDFYFDGDVMMLITKDKDYVPYHKNDQLAHTLLSTIPVIFAGVETKLKDDMGREIFTGDVVTYQGYTSLVRYFNDAEFPGLAGDNCDILFEGRGTMHKEGTAFVNVDPTMFKEYNPMFVRWTADAFCQGGPSFAEIAEKASVAMDVPTFIEGTSLRKKMQRFTYDEIEEVLTNDKTLTYFRDCEANDEDENGEPCYFIFADNFPDYQVEKHYEIPMPDKEDFVGDMKKAFNDFLIYAHSRPEETFVLADFKGIFHINSNYKYKVATAFDEWYEYNIRNVILPRWIFFALGSLHGIGKD